MSRKQSTSRRETAAGPAPWLGVPAAIALAFVVVPFIGMFAEVQWGDLPTLLAGEAARDALWLSLKTTFTSTIISLLLGIPLAHILAHTSHGARASLGSILRLLVTLPMVVPPVVAGLALLVTFGRRGLIGSYLHVLGIEIGFSAIAVVMAQVFVSMPFLVISLEGALRSRGRDLEKAASNLGASRTRIFFEITLPLTVPAMASGTALTFARALGEFGATITFAGSLQGVTRTLPLEIYLQREIDTATALALATVILLVAGLVIAITSAISKISAKRSSAEARGREPESARQNQLDTMCALSDLDMSLQQWENAPVGIEINAGVSKRHVHIDAKLKRGAITAIVGPNGSGKTTGIELIAGTLTPSSGSRSLNLGEDPTIVWLEQRALLFPHLTACQNVAFGPRIRGLSSEAATKRALAELEAVGCLHLKDRLPSELSGGQAQRVAIARALAVNPDLILLDEPFAAVDSEIAWPLRLVLRERIRAAKATAVMVTHDLTDAGFMADQIITLEEGQVSESGFKTQVLQPPSSAFLTRLTGANTVTEGNQVLVVRPSDFRVEAGHAEGGIHGQILRRVLSPTGEIAIISGEDGELLSISINAYNADLLQPGSAVTLHAQPVESLQ
ncbi:ABC transporter permease [uncultured Actinomyces sp.]|uniref:ABC transporter permease n=1 Tax=uncultured Actinomyces sp. TaxID=249061 RepID=UPI002889EC11|nr:ABC transporter permease [uncultured Actinomyces sp.]